MSEMINRIEAAIYEACDYALPPHLLKKAARAAIEAMREPTADMIAAAYRRNDDNDHIDATKENWRAMIDAAFGKVEA